MSQVLLSAFTFGLISALSLPLGALTSRFWRPGDRVIAFLMAFGGGALLAALTIDLAGPALAKGHFYWLATGCIIGGIVFVVLDQLVNQHGGFLRKASTTVFHLRYREASRFRRVKARMKRLNLFADLPTEIVNRLGRATTQYHFKKGGTLFHQGDQSDCLYFVEEGQVDLLDPYDGMNLLFRIQPGESVGHNAFLTNSLHAAVARAHTDGSVLVLPRQAFETITTESDELQKAIVEYLNLPATSEYLRDRQHLEDANVTDWLQRAVESVKTGEPIPPTHVLPPDDSDFRETLEKVSRVPIFQELPDEDIEFLAKTCFTKTHERGHTFFHAGEPADRLRIVEAGEVVLIDPKKDERNPVRIKAVDEFGALSFLTGARHSVTAVASSDVTVRILLRRHFDTLMKQSPAFASAVEEFIKQETLSEYLQEKHHFDTDKTARWVSQAIGKRMSGKHLPSAAAMTREIQQHQGAPIAIWLGIMLDGIPESLVIGASIGSSGAVSTSLLAGLFLSNYPEALSSSVGMRQQGMKFSRIVVMWTSLMLLTGIGAALGVVFFSGAPPVSFSLVQGVAAGAMLTMIAQTMLPEAFFKGGSITGFATLLGFLAAIFFKTLDPGGGH